MLSSDEFLDFVCIGAPRSGTTWLSEALAEHPQIWVPAAKELNFFNGVSENHLEFKYLRGIDYYRKQFEKAPPTAILGELTPTYYADRESASRIYKHFPNVRILIMLRNPAEVVFSTFLKRREYGKSDKTFEAAIARSPELLSLGFYHRLLKPYFELFPRENIHVAVYEHFFRDPLEGCSAIYAFLGVDDSFTPSVLDRRVNQRREVRFEMVVSARHHLRRLINTRTLLPLKKLLTRSTFFDDLSEKIIGWNLKNGPSPQLLPETRAWLMTQYDSDIRDLHALLDVDLGVWESTDSDGSE
jgi:hypothetical protein